MSSNVNRTEPGTSVTIEPLVKTVVVPVDVTRAFELFTEEISTWWPLATHSVGLAEAVSVRIGGFVGGAIVETMSDGSTTVSGTVTTWTPPDEIGFTWHPGGTPERASHVSVSFSQTDRGTRVVLTHTGWDALERGSALRDSYDVGWDLVLGHYTDLAGGNG